MKDGNDYIELTGKTGRSLNCFIFGAFMFP